MIEPCPPDFWDRVAKLVAEKILIRESSLAGVRLDKPVPVAVVGREPPEGPRAA